MADRSGAAQPSTGDRVWPVFRSLAGYRAAFLSRDLFAGLTLAAIVIPEQMATARLGGFAPQIGFFAFVAGSLAFAAFGAAFGVMLLGLAGTRKVTQTSPMRLLREG